MHEPGYILEYADFLCHLSDDRNIRALFERALSSLLPDESVELAHNIFEAGLKRFMHEPGYILEYADFLCHLSDDRNIRALFERATSFLRRIINPSSIPTLFPILPFFLHRY
ncbi:uncharacterized protein [Primulina huaijiensis]|uniref:uncharacterized protein n=1 Tax=Primulina huaijiensis TaxID=1492673 RepID=UPI003CC74D2B